MYIHQERYEKMKKALKELHWNETDGIWYDYDLEKKVFFCNSKKINKNLFL